MNDYPIIILNGKKIQVHTIFIHTSHFHVILNHYTMTYICILLPFKLITYVIYRVKY